MANIAYVPVNKDWTLVTELIGNGFSFDSDTLYVIEARGSGDVLILDSDTEPTTDNYGGVKLDGEGYKIAKYTPISGNNLYIRLHRNSLESGINISTEEGE